MADHALLSPSGASRWLACPPSARLEEQYQSSTSSAAEEGTLAHELSELYLRNNLKQISQVNYNSNLKRIKHNKYYTTELNGHCLDYVSFILDKLHSVKDPMIFIEEKIDLGEYVSESFGTCDAIILSHRLLDVNDLKYGKGVLVEAHENKQMMLYALGALEKYSLMYQIDTVRMTIYQPRLENYSSFEMNAQDLIKWGNEYVKPTAKLAFEGKGQYTAGSHCKFCKARNRCKTLADHNMNLAKFAFEDPNKLSDEDIAEIVIKAYDFTTWLSSVKLYALQESIKNQKKWPGLKLVEGRSNRRYTDEKEIIEKLKKAKIKYGLYMAEPKLVTVTKLESNIGKSEVSKLVGDMIIKPKGAATLAPEWDKRPAITGAEAAKVTFDEIDSEE